MFDFNSYEKLNGTLFQYNGKVYGTINEIPEIIMHGENFEIVKEKIRHLIKSNGSNTEISFIIKSFNI